MLHSEFTELHGDEAWNKLVLPRKIDGGWSSNVRTNANIISHLEVVTFLQEQGLEADGLIAAEIMYNAGDYDEAWSDLLARTIFSEEFLEQTKQDFKNTIQ